MGNSILIVDDHDAVRASLLTWIAATFPSVVCVEAASGEEALALVCGSAPDLALMDVDLPGINGIEATTRLKEIAPDTKVIIVSIHDTDSYRAAAEAAGASGYVSKQHMVAELSAILPRFLGQETVQAPVPDARAAIEVATNSDSDDGRRFLAAVEQAAEAVVITGADGRIDFVNPAFEALTGYSRAEVIGKNPSILKSGKHPPELYRDLWNTLLDGRTWRGRLINRRKDGSFFEEEAVISPVRDAAGAIESFVAVKRDVTHEAALEAQLRQSQKMQVVGELVGGVAHDFNNLLQAMLSHTQLLRSQSREPAGVLDIAGELEAHIRRGASLTRQLLLFSRRESARVERLDLNDVVRNTTQMLRRLVRANIALATELSPEPVPVEIDLGQLEQVLMNLAVNASDAMPDGGRLAIRTGSLDHNEVWLAVEDSGQGIPEEIRPRIFEPFFTTKGAGKGTGLGLSVVHGIVALHGGRIEVESELGRGSAFKVVLPRAMSNREPRAEAAQPLTADLEAGTGERILVVEDEDAARDGLRQFLQALGYEAIAVGSAEEAMASPADRPFDALLTDLMLPGASGGELAKDLRKRWPAVKVILMSGYTEDEAVRLGGGAGYASFLQKPFDMATLAREVRAALDRQTDTAL